MALPDSPPAPEPVHAPRQTRSPRWLLVVVGAFALLVAAGWWTQRPLARIPLPHGGELLLVEAHYAPTFHLAQHIGFWERVQHYLPGHHGDPSDVSDEFVGGNVGGPTALWLVFKGKGSRNALDFALIQAVVTMDSKLMVCGSSAWQASDGGGRGMRYIVGIGVYPRRARDLHLRIITGDQTIEATIPNPFPVTDAPPWTPQPIPQSRKLQSGEIVLRGLHLDSVETPEGDTSVTGSSIEAELEVRDGDIPSEAFAIESVFSDATGNRSDRILPTSEPAWAIHTSVRRTADYPFPLLAGTSLGPVTMPGAGEFRVLPLPVDDATDFRRYVLLAGPGKYEVSVGSELKVTSLDPAGDAALSGPKSFQCEKPQCRFISESNQHDYNNMADPYRIVRVIASGQIIFNQHVSDETYPDERPVKAHEFSVDPPPGTELDVQVIVTHAESVDFYVRPPQ